MDKLSNNNYFDEHDKFVIKYFSIISIITATTFCLIYIFSLNIINLIYLNLFFISLYSFCWYKGIKDQKWYFVYIIIIINMLHVFIYTYFLFGFDMKFYFYFLMYPMAILIIREAKIDIAKIITIVISILLFAIREIIGYRINTVYSVSFSTSRIINVFVVSSLILGLTYILYSYIAKLNNVKEELYVQSITDQLTGSYNRRYLFDKYSEIKENSYYYKCLMILDIDAFKTINDFYGHHIGDKVIKTIAEVITETIDNSGIVSRIGGEEFCIVLNNISQENIQDLAEKIRKDIAETKIKANQNKNISCTVSIGVVCKSDDNQTFDKLFVLADNAMYSAKYSGKNRVVFYNNL